MLFITYPRRASRSGSLCTRDSHFERQAQLGVV